MAKEGYSTSSLYQGGYSSLDPLSGEVLTGYSSDIKSIALGTDARTANILKEVSSKISTGTRAIEMTQVFPEVFEAIPKDQFKEVQRVAELTGVDISLHAPIVGLDPSGFQEGKFSEMRRQAVEEQMLSSIKRGHELNPQGNIPITFHAAEGIPEVYDRPGSERKEGYVIDVQNKSLAKIPLKKRNYPGENGVKGIVDLKKEIEKINEESWSQSKSDLGYYGGHAINYIDNYFEEKKELEKVQKEIADTEGAEAAQAIDMLQRKAKLHYNEGVSMLNNSYRQLKQLYETAYAYGSEKDKPLLQNFAKEIEKNAISISKNEGSEESVRLKKEIVEKGLEVFNQIQQSPTVVQEVQDFLLDKSSSTFGKVAFKSWESFKESTPIINIENSYAGAAFSRGEDLRKVIEKSREEFVRLATSKGNLSESDARKQAEKIIGATWDLGRINTLRQHGFTKEEIISETEKIAPFVKHVHLSDNFGYGMTELPMGMGNAPAKEMLERLEAKGFKGKKAIEAMSWYQHFSPQGSPPNSALLPTYIGLGGQMSASEGAPYWSQTTGLQQGYFGGYGGMLPDLNYQTFGAGFSNLPSELGGTRAGGGGRMSGHPME